MNSRRIAELACTEHVSFMTHVEKIIKDPHAVALKGRVRFVGFFDQGTTYVSRGYTNPTWVDIMRVTDELIEETEDWDNRYYWGCCFSGINQAGEKVYSIVTKDKKSNV